MVTLTELPNGALRLSLDKDNKYWADDLAELTDRHGGNDLAFLGDVLDHGYIGNDWWLITADDLGNLSEAPCICYDAIFDDFDGPPTDFGKVWYFATYQTESVAETLRDKGEVIFQPLHHVPAA